MHHTADGKSGRYCILFSKMKINVNQISVRMEMRHQNEIAYEKSKDHMSFI